MSETTAIEWCDSTFNPWIGCTRVSSACDDCYAARSTPARTLGVEWGPRAERYRTSVHAWREPLRWEKWHHNFEQSHGRRRRVFCASLADVFDNEVPTQWRMDLFSLIAATPHLDWLLLTKRIGNVESMCSGDSLMFEALSRNVWLGITVCNQQEAERDIPKLLGIAARMTFLSIEPMLGPITLDRRLIARIEGGTQHGRRFIDWVICGGESGPKARPMHPDWARSLRDQCAAAGVPFLFKQWGEWTEQDDSGLPGVRTVREGDPQYESEAAKCDAFMAIDGELIWSMDDSRDGVGYRGLARVGKKAAGRLLDGLQHDGSPMGAIR